MGISVLAFRGMDVSRSQLVTEVTNIYNYRDDKMSSDLKQSPSFLFMVRPAAFGFNTETGVSRFPMFWNTHQFNDCYTTDVSRRTTTTRTVAQQ